MGAGAVVLLMVAIAVAAPLLATYIIHHNPYSIDLSATFSTPGRAHWLGTDEAGRDTLTRLMYGAQVTLTVAFLAVAVALVVGGTVGLVAGFYGGWIDNLLMRFVDVLLSIPAIYLLILLTILQPKIGPIVLSTSDPRSLAVIIAVVGWGGLSRLVRGEVLSVRNREFMLATRSIGASDLRLLTRHLLPNVLAVMIVAASLNVGAVIITESVLDFIGLGIQPPLASWGNMLTNSQTYFYHSIWLVMLPGALIFITVLAMNIFGNALRDAFDPRLK
jgi:peptide/nickel transport system permease protein